MTPTPEQSADSHPPIALAREIADAALLRGSFTLRSGRTSSYYLDKFRILTNPATLSKVAQAMADRVTAIEAQTHTPFDRIAGAALGGVPLATAVSQRLGRPSLFVRDAKKDYGTANRIEGLFEPGMSAVLVEDVATTAGAAIEAVGVLREAGLTVDAVVCVVDRQEGARANAEAAGLRFEPMVTKADLGIDE